MKYEIPCLLLVGSTLVPYWHLTFLHVGFYFAVTWAVIHCRKQRNLSENQFAECKEYKPTLAYKCECRQKSLILPNVGNICIHWILWVCYTIQFSIIWRMCYFPSPQIPHNIWSQAMSWKSSERWWFHWNLKRFLGTSSLRIVTVEVVAQ